MTFQPPQKVARVPGLLAAMLLLAACRPGTLATPPPSSPSYPPGLVARVTACGVVQGSPVGHEATVNLRFEAGSPLARYGTPLGVFDYLAIGSARQGSDAWGSSTVADTLAPDVVLTDYGSEAPDVAKVGPIGVVVAQPARISAASVAALAGRSAPTPFGRLYVEHAGMDGDSMAVTLAVVPRMPGGYDISTLLQATFEGGGRSFTVRRAIPRGTFGWVAAGPNGTGSFVSGPSVHRWATFVFHTGQSPTGPVTIQVDQWGIRVPGSFVVRGLAEACK